MNKNQMNELFRELEASYHTIFGWSQEEKIDAMRVWFTHLNEYDFEDGKAGVRDYILHNAKTPTIFDIRTAIERASKAKNMRTPIVKPRGKAVRCIHCRDTGLIVTESPTGIRLGRPCEECELGRIMYRWYFMSEEERREAEQRAATRGQVVRPMVADKEFYMSYVYGQ